MYGAQVPSRPSLRPSVSVLHPSDRPRPPRPSRTGPDSGPDPESGLHRTGRGGRKDVVHRRPVGGIRFVGGPEESVLFRGFNRGEGTKTLTSGSD